MAGGLFVGTLGLAFPQVFGVGYETLELALQGHLAPLLMGGLLVAKVAATSLTLGSGGSGGVFSPSLFMGAMLGGALGSVVHSFFPAITAPSGAYALVGMAAVFAGAAQTPITSIVILFEMTGDYRIILPLMTAVGISSLVSHFMSRESIYTIKLRRRGIDILAPVRPDPLASVRVADTMVREVVTLDEKLPLRGILEYLRRHPFTSFPVTDGDGALVGILGYGELRDPLTSGTPQDGLTARDLMRAPPPVSYPEETLSDLMEKFRISGVGRLPVVSREQPSRLLGVISHSDLLAAYERAVPQKPRSPAANGPGHGMHA